MGQNEISPESGSVPAVMVEYGTDVTVVTFKEDRIVDENQVRKIQEVLEPVVEKNGNKQLVFNFTQIKLINSLLLNLLISVRQRVCELGGQVQLRNLKPNIYTILEITQLTDIFNIS
ncbi:MAG: hypothetical protein A2Z25_06805 [Planctomycetes bacterium RBG_16_55_9]|nr:MAG: hypothetical protein A2Z25_06805 [Planctomycetes bacterium RBG_16_55_9]